MKSNSVLRILIILSLVFISCSKEHKRNSDFFPIINVDISDNIKVDAELVDIIISTEKAINEFSDNIEQLAIDKKYLKNDNSEDVSLIANQDSTKLILHFVSNITQMKNHLENFNIYIERKYSQGMVSDAQLKDLKLISLKFGNRVTLIEEKYK
jgi:hypothetical protein